MSVSIRLSLVVFGAALAVQACASDDPPAFPENYQTTYVKMAECTKSSSHTEGPYVISWLSPAAEAAWRARTALPAGSVLVKSQHNDAACKTLLKYTAMRKDGSAWTWQQIESDRSVTNSGAIAVCSSCHTACKANDWVCTAP